MPYDEAESLENIDEEKLNDILRDSLGKSAGGDAEIESLMKIAEMLKLSQEIEKSKYNILKKEADNVAAGRAPTLSEAAKNQLIEAINVEADRRRYFYDIIKTSRLAQSAAETMASKAAKEQILTMQFLETNLDSAKKALNALSEDKHQKMKMVEINTYFGKQYQGYGELLRGLVLVFGLLLVFMFLRQKFSQFGMVFQILETLTKWIGGFYLLYLLYDVLTRRNDDYDEYIFPVAPTTDDQMKNANSASGAIIDISGIDIPQLCAGSFCCGPGTTWSDSSGCVFSDLAQVD
jgi:hypothetical protein